MNTLAFHSLISHHSPPLLLTSIIFVSNHHHSRTITLPITNIGSSTYKLTRSLFVGVLVPFTSLPVTPAKHMDYFYIAMIINNAKKKPLHYLYMLSLLRKKMTSLHIIISFSNP